LNGLQEIEKKGKSLNEKLDYVKMKDKTGLEKWNGQERNK